MPVKCLRIQHFLELDRTVGLGQWERESRDDRKKEKTQEEERKRQEWDLETETVMAGDKVRGNEEMNSSGHWAPQWWALAVSLPLHSMLIKTRARWFQVQVQALGTMLHVYNALFKYSDLLCTPFPQTPQMCAIYAPHTLTLSHTKKRPIHLSSLTLTLWILSAMMASLVTVSITWSHCSTRSPYG